MYRAVGLAFLRRGLTATAEHAASLLPALDVDVQYEGDQMCVYLGREDVTQHLRRPDVGQAASAVGKLAAVRQKLVAEQQRIGSRYRNAPGVVLEGRDIGTVVFPGAEVKIFMIAHPEVRAARRHAELVAQGDVVPFEVVLEEIVARDRQDSERALSPLRQAEDAVALDTTERTIAEQIQFVVDLVREREQTPIV